MPSHQVLQRKIGEVEEVAQLMKQYKVVGIASLQKVRAAQLQEFKRNLADKVMMRVAKNTLMRRAVEKSEEKGNLKKLAEHFEGANIFLFTDLNPFRLALLLEKGKIMTTAKSGDRAAFDVIVPAGNTGQPPGPIISQLNAVGLPTRIESGSVWITRDTLVARRGGVISERLATVLTKLGMKPVEAGLSMKVAYDDGVIVTEEQLRIDLDGIRRSLGKAHADAVALSLDAAYPTMGNMEMLVRIAHRRSCSLALGAAVPLRDTIEDLIRKAYAEMLLLSSHVENVEKS